MKEYLIIFTRYPEPGITKTRLIPVLGIEGAAKLHRELALCTIAQAKQIQNSRQLLVEVYFTGGSQQLMQAWLGSDIFYQNQVTGDLGTKMAAAFQISFNSGVEKVVIVGTDCPDLNSQIMALAFDELAVYDLVLGPALDGGYYLIGLRQFVPELFKSINWGTAEVLQQTVAIARNLNLAVAYLPPLADIDRPEDLSILDLKY
ncbi:MAG TPA: TIGR04282 family arsenosugar biosynthesis glycosyltransferase [Kamptonema sp.]|nr:TIGR04282 family arsenosugar biosynthesis glycosyltransferase [Kamptonema sp.]